MRDQSSSVFQRSRDHLSGKAELLRSRRYGQDGLRSITLCSNGCVADRRNSTESQFKVRIVWSIARFAFKENWYNCT